MFDAIINGALLNAHMGFVPKLDALFARLFTSGADRESLVVLHSASKGLLDEIKHARRGLDQAELNHVTAELDVIISILESEHRLVRRFQGSEQLREAFVQAHAAISDPESDRALMHELDRLNDRALEMHTFLERRIPAGDHLSFRPPHHQRK